MAREDFESAQKADDVHAVRLKQLREIIAGYGHPFAGPLKEISDTLKPESPMAVKTEHPTLPDAGEEVFFPIQFLAATSNQQPATSNQQPATSNQQPATSNQQQINQLTN